MTSVTFRNRSDSGLVLVAVLWISASLALLLTSVISVQRNELREASQQADRLNEMLGADSAIRRRLFDLLVQRNAIAPVPYTIVDQVFEGRSFLVEIISSSGLFNVELASESLLVDVFEYGAGLDRVAASNLARALVAYRNSAREAGSKFAFAVAEDMLKVPGMRYQYFQRIQGLVFVDSEGSPLVNLRAAPLDVLLVVYKNDRRAAEGFFRTREQGAALPEAESVGRYQVVESAGGTYVVRATAVRSEVEVESPALPVRVWWVRFGASGGGEGKPWNRYWSYFYYPASYSVSGIKR